MAPPRRCYINVDLSRAHDRRVLAFFIPASAGFLLLTAMGSYHTYHFTESVEFCGEACHTVMKPELTTYLHSPHARVACAECHIGKGAEWYVRSKLSGTYQVYATLAAQIPHAHSHAGQESAPGPGNLRTMPLAQEICRQSRPHPLLLSPGPDQHALLRFVCCSKSAAAIPRTGRSAASIGT